MRLTTRSLFDSIQNVLDYFLEAELAVFINSVSMTANRVSFHLRDPAVPFLTSREHTVDQYLSWVESGAYSAILYDGSLLQLTYDIDGRQLVGHRLAYVPCPFDVDSRLLTEGEPIADVVELHRGNEVLLRTPIRFDYDPASAHANHPASHLTINGSDCRIACAAPLHVLRFLDFIFRQFYFDQWVAHGSFFEPAGWAHLEASEAMDIDRSNVHLAWDTHVTQSQMSLGRG